ncbi:shikimate kinase AroK [Thioalkalivibrio sp. XN8]|uniref:shikimate kinase AroK n=1 Tax=Thioalkalivibrio sp. XN8 TaxID=2712863 RepID=UPI0023F2C58F|nr:shikimate kinase AroK [Thioalkalivibrio sp. XN8]
MPNIILVGPMGAGKSAVGRQLARLLHRDFFDSDAEIEHRTGVDVSFIFEKEGEAGFRRREREMIAELAGREGIVLATGGGAVVDPENRAALASSGLVVYLEASVEQQLERTRLSTNRPLLDAPDPAARLATLLQEREPLYRELAALVVPTDGRMVKEVAQEIRRWLAEHDGNH